MSSVNSALLVEGEEWNMKGISSFVSREHSSHRLGTAQLPQTSAIWHVPDRSLRMGTGQEQGTGSHPLISCCHSFHDCTLSMTLHSFQSLSSWAVNLHSADWVSESAVIKIHICFILAHSKSKCNPDNFIYPSPPLMYLFKYALHL